MNPSEAEGVLDVRLTEIALFVGGGIVTLMVLALAIWLFVRASREEREQDEEPGPEAGESHALKSTEVAAPLPFAPRPRLS